ncbi:MAG: transcription elongation factor GreA [Firmicutes bacterium HGW-Firmicutes-21]|nr:MAG: transcription elongation factor GreA [Firmicutes bacterium HGW-Firmicutes-21]
MSKQIIVSNEGLNKLQSELEHLKTVKRKEVAQAIQKARSFGDLSENSEYDEAKNEQAEIEGKIAHLEETLKYAIVLDDKDLGTDKVSIGNKVTVHSIDNDEDTVFKIVSSTEADPMNFCISDESPLGKALVGQKIGDSINVETPSGITKYTIAAISK